MSIPNGGLHLLVPHFTGGVYAIRCTANGCVYYGASSDMRSRVANHKFALRAGTHHNKRMMLDYTIYGEGAFISELVELVPNLRSRLRLEAKLIRRTAPHHRYNHIYKSGHCVMGNVARRELQPTNKEE